MDFVGAAKPLTDQEIVQEGQRLGVDPAAIWAVCEVESAGSGFLPDKRPKILFEAHYFHTLTHGRYDRVYPNISSPVWDRSLYGSSGTHQYTRMTVAISLNRAAGLESASWGRFQIMGANYAACGYPGIEEFVQAMLDDEHNHLTAFGNFCRSNGIVGYLANHDWAHFALRYNGAGQVAMYVHRLSAAYAAYPGTRTTPPTTTGGILKKGDQDHGNAVVLLQLALIKNGYSVDVSGVFDAITDAAVRSFQSQHGLTPDGLVGPKTKAALGI